jgi:hypothetical protein
VLASPVTNGSFETAYGLWVDSWDTALAAVATATETRILSVEVAARHRAVIASERKLVIEELALLTGHVYGSGRAGAGTT